MNREEVSESFFGDGAYFRIIVGLEIWFILLLMLDCNCIVLFVLVSRGARL